MPSIAKTLEGFDQLSPSLQSYVETIEILQSSRGVTGDFLTQVLQKAINSNLGRPTEPAEFATPDDLDTTANTSRRRLEGDGSIKLSPDGKIQILDSNGRNIAFTSTADPVLARQILTSLFRTGGTSLERYQQGMDALADFEGVPRTALPTSSGNLTLQTRDNIAAGALTKPLPESSPPVVPEVVTLANPIDPSNGNVILEDSGQQEANNILAQIASGGNAGNANAGTGGATVANGDPSGEDLISHYGRFLAARGILGGQPGTAAERYIAGLFNPIRNIYDLQNSLGLIERQEGDPLPTTQPWDQFAGQFGGDGLARATQRESLSVLRRLANAPESRRALENINWTPSYDPYTGESTGGSELESLAQLIRPGLSAAYGGIGATYMARNLPKYRNVFERAREQGTTDATSFLNWLQKRFGF